MKTIIGNKIKKLRLAKNLSQVELSEKLNITQASLSAYERNAKLPSLDVLVKICVFFEISLDWLCGLETTENFSPQPNSSKSVIIEPKTMDSLIMNILPALKDFYNLESLKIDIIGEEPASSTFTMSGFSEGSTKYSCGQYLMKFLYEYNDLLRQLSFLSDKQICNDYLQIWLKKQLKFYSSIPIR